MRAKKIDANQNEIVNALRKIPGVKVAITSALGDGFVDIVVGYQKQNYLIELKDGNKPPSDRKLTPDEVKFHEGWTGQVGVAQNIDEVLTIIGLTSKAA